MCELLHTWNYQYFYGNNKGPLYQYAGESGSPVLDSGPLSKEDKRLPTPFPDPARHKLTKSLKDNARTPEKNQEARYRTGSVRTSTSQASTSHTSRTPSNKAKIAGSVGFMQCERRQERRNIHERERPL
jgi:hypothetical protein